MSGNSRLLRKQSEQGPSKVALVAGDLAQTSTFAEIQARFEIETMPKPNILLLTPAGGTNCLPGGQPFIDKIVAPALAICDQGSFAFLGDAPDGNEPFLEAFLDNVRINTGAQTALRKCGDSPIFGIFKR
jgi:hypothetical protein